jgi:hypothetical protein
MHAGRVEAAALLLVAVVLGIALASVLVAATPLQPAADLAIKPNQITLM